MELQHTSFFMQKTKRHYSCIPNFFIADLCNILTLSNVTIETSPFVKICSRKMKNSDGIMFLI